MTYKKRFDIRATAKAVDGRRKKTAPVRGDRRDARNYVYTGDIELTINVALATGRPILLRGPSGSGKTALAKNVALRMERRYYEFVVTSRMQHTDVQWHFDTLRRFRDANDKSLKPDAAYLEPRAIWWAFDRESAKWRGAKLAQRAEVPAATDPSELPGNEAVVLLDEIDKADPDVPNNLLDTFGSLQFSLPVLDDLRINALSPPLMFITSNDERDLPAAFVRRCIVLELKGPSANELLEIAEAHYGPARKRLYRKVAELIGAFDVKTSTTSTAEYLDAIQACIELGVAPNLGDPTWDAIMRVAVRKAVTPGEGRV